MKSRGKKDRKIRELRRCNSYIISAPEIRNKENKR
jgi:hypothetical protein